MALAPEKVLSRIGTKRDELDKALGLVATHSARLAKAQALVEASRDDLEWLMLHPAARTAQEAGELPATDDVLNPVKIQDAEPLI